MRLEVQPRNGLKNDDEIHSRRKKPRGKKKGQEENKDPTGGDIVSDRYDISVEWDPWKQKWISTIVIVSNSGGTKRVTVFERETKDFPNDMDVPNTQNDSSKTDNQLSIDRVFDSDDDDMISVIRSSEPKENGFSGGGVLVHGYAMGSSQIQGIHDKIYSWVSDTYTLKSPANKPVTVAFKGALLSGAQLNVLTGSHDYDTGMLYEVTNISPEYWFGNGKENTNEPQRANVNDFVNRNKGTELEAEWTPSNVAVSLEVAVISAEDQSAFFQNAFIKSYEDQLLDSLVPDPSNWKVKNNYDPSVIDQLINNLQKYNAMKDAPYEVKLMLGVSLSTSWSDRWDWLYMFGKTYPY